MNQPELPVARRTDPGTSWAAAKSIPTDKLRVSQLAVLTTLRLGDSMTDQEIEENYPGPSQSPSGLRTRRKELVDQGLVEDSGARRRLRSGRQGIVWRAV